MNTPDFCRLDPVISALYEATLHPKRWYAALQGMAHLGEAQAAVFIDMDYALSVLWRHVLYNVDEEAHHVYLKRYAQIDPRLPVMMKAPELRWLSDVEALSEATRTDNPVYRDYLVPSGLKECLMAKAAVEGARHGHVVLLKIGVSDRFSAEQRATLELLLPHVDRAVRISRRLAGFARALAFGSRGIDESDEPVAALTSNGCISEANPAFERLLANGDIFVADHGHKLRCKSDDAQARLGRSIADALELAKGNTRHDSRNSPVVTVDRAGAPPLLVTVTPLMQMGAQPWFEQVGVLIKVSDPLRPPSEEVLQQGFSFTAAEARLARALLGGGTLAEVALRIGVSVNTVKTQLQVVFQKTRTTRQPELVALLHAVRH
ncbi:helix-turn-helix transcriptional regulator [Thauera sinica]|uniref:Helix-turn-helix transcriptional regulator n=1 Tax=Thauera sinica TaxID=2665146 RepID=A0ABW1ATV4_9RHOO|nr:helix-turn-helix transcriptional regulator [Thauera sp. K11]ATE58798.1 hypothetical protein CCZ27_01450 [Thauera sp. K11]